MCVWERTDESEEEKKGQTSEHDLPGRKMLVPLGMTVSLDICEKVMHMFRNAANYGESSQ